MSKIHNTTRKLKRYLKWFRNFIPTVNT